MKKFTVDSFRTWIPRQPQGEPPITPRWKTVSPEKITRLLYSARKFNSVLKHANQGYLDHLDKVMRMTFGRIGPKKYELLAKFIDPSSNGDTRVLEHGHKSYETDDVQELSNNDESERESEDRSSPSLQPPIQNTSHHSNDLTASTTGAGNPKTELGDHFQTFIAFYTDPRNPEKRPFIEENPPSWKYDVHPSLQALLASQASEQPHTKRAGSSRRIKPKFSAPAQNIWGKPLPLSQYKNKRIEWYKRCIQAAMPPLETEQAYWDVHDLVTGKTEMPPFVRKRAAPKPDDQEAVEKTLKEQAELILDGPKFGQRRKTEVPGQPKTIDPRLIQRILSRVVLSHTPLVVKTPPGAKSDKGNGLLFYWDDGLSRQKMNAIAKETDRPLSDSQRGLLFA